MQRFMKSIPVAALTAALLFGSGMPAPAAAQEPPGKLSIPPTPGMQDTARGTIHIVRRGDTLWDLSTAYMRTPWTWPSIYQVNQDSIADPHWIYPGQRILIPIGGGAPIVLSFEEVWPGEVSAADMAAQQAAAMPAVPQPQAPQTDVTEMEMPPTTAGSGVLLTGFRVAELRYYPLASQAVVLAAGHVGEPRDWPLGRIIDGENADMNMSLYNRVFLDIGEERAKVGDLYIVVEQGPRVKHPEWGHYLGRKVEVKGIIRIEDVRGSTSQGVVVQVFDAIRRRDRVIPAPSVDARPWREFIPVQGGRSGQVVAKAKDDGNLHPYDFLFIDGGSEEGIQVGDLYAIRRPETERGRLRFFQDELARGVVISVQDATATLMLLQVTEPGIQAGETVTLIGRSVFETGPGGG